MAKSRLTAANIPSIGKRGQQRLANAKFAIAGLGGVGGIAFELLLRAGAGELRIADPDLLELSNTNRQLLGSRQNDSMKKQDAARLLANSINPMCGIISFGKITDANSAKFASGCAAVIDATDSLHSRMAVWRGCRASRVPYVFSSALRTKGMLSVFFGADFELEFGLSKKSTGDFIACDHALGPVANAIGCLAAQQAMNIALHKPAILFPSVLSLDAFSAIPLTIHNF